MHDDRKKDERSDAQQTLALTKRTLVVQSAMIREACPYYAVYYAL